MNQRSVRWRIHSEERRFILLAVDILVALLSLVIALIAWGSRDWLDVSWALIIDRVPSWFFYLPLIWVILLIEMYDIRRAGRRDETIKGVGIAAGVSLVIYLLLFFLVTVPTDLPRFGVAVFIISAAVLTLIWRFAYIAIFTQPDFLRRSLIIGAGRAGSALAKICHEMRPQPFHLIGLIDDDPEKKNTQIEGFPVLGGGCELLEIIQKERVSDMIFAISNEMRPDTFRALLQAAENGVEITTMPVIYEQLMRRVPIFLLRSDWILRSFVDEVHANGLYELAKRLMDIVGGLIGSILYILVYPFVALAIIIETGKPVLYKQTRLGQNGKEYTIIKFRTMYQDSEKDGKVRVTVENDKRITRIGKFLRKSHLDEIPQFVNVLSGEMSLIGPRAERSELVNNLQNKVPFYRARLLVKPGITGWAQVNFGYAATVEDTAIKLEYDLYYIKNRNLLLDLTILIRTIGTVVGFKGQ
jgi:exopolysaccharide biosynthesis polyprenyl glycosylphosphotransferase